MDSEKDPLDKQILREENKVLEVDSNKMGKKDSDRIQPVFSSIRLILADLLQATDA